MNSSTIPDQLTTLITEYLIDSLADFNGDIETLASGLASRISDHPDLKQFETLRRSNLGGDMIAFVDDRTWKRCSNIFEAFDWLQSINREGRIYERMASDAARQVCVIEEQQAEIERLRKVHKAARKAWLFFRGYVSDGVPIPEFARGTGHEWNHRLLNLWEAVKNTDPPSGEHP